MSFRSTHLWDALDVLFQSHPWHGVPLGTTPGVYTAYIEIVPTDAVKYELDKVTGLLKVDRPQRFSNQCPSLYGLLPRTLCGARVAERATERTGRPRLLGDDDPLDICVLTERPILHGNVLVQARPIGGLRMLDGQEADDKIVAVLEDDPVYGGMREIRDCPSALIDRLRHYFLTYKQSPDQTERACEIAEIYDREEAHEVVQRSRDDYTAYFAHFRERISQVMFPADA